jgi:hypothetical protein
MRRGKETVTEALMIVEASGSRRGARQGAAGGRVVISRRCPIDPPSGRADGEAGR